MKKLKRFFWLMKTYGISPVSALRIIFIHDPEIARLDKEYLDNE